MTRKPDTMTVDAYRALLDKKLDDFCYGRFVRWERDEEGNCVRALTEDGNVVLVNDWKKDKSEISPDTLRYMAAYFFRLGISEMIHVEGK